jgi:DNA-binding NarL/FixJ family response regulator
LEAASKTASVETTYEYSIAEILSPEELQIVQLRAQGYKHDEIAVLLNMKSGTVRTKLSRIKDKVTKFLED